MQQKTNRVCKPKKKQNKKKKKKISNMVDDVAQQEHNNNNCYASAFRYIQMTLPPPKRVGDR